MIGFDFQPRTRLIFGVGCVDRVGELVREYGGTRVLLVTDRGVSAAGHANRVRSLLQEIGLNAHIFDAVHENPTTLDVDACLIAARQERIDLFVALGGGSAMDTAKGCNFLLTNGGQMRDYWGVGKAAKPMLPLIAIPTTAGTGSEMQSFALIADDKTHRKMACGDPKASPRAALLDPMLTLTQPRRVTACSGIDAVAHAVESAVTTRRTDVSTIFARRAFALTNQAFSRVMSDPNDLEARGRMLVGAAYAGIAIENSMLGAAHAAANPLTARYGIIHGHAVGIMLPHVVRYNAHNAESRATYASMMLCADDAHAGDLLATRLGRLMHIADLPRSLSSCGVEAGMLETLAKEATNQWTAGFNPRTIRPEEFLQLYEAAFEPGDP